MRKVDITISVGTDGFYSAYCNEHPAVFGSGETPDEAISELRETLELIREDGKETAMFYPEWLDEEYVFQVNWNIKDLLAYYSGIITPTALGRLSGINPKQVWAYMSGQSKPRRAQLDKMEKALNRLGNELSNLSFC
ncbi:MAG: type II toxin-antitoxin system HicB family antitoxin [Bacteroidales bacterium]|nr:type II toxin-antitoxin system HicB family antitoxin [Bacteroidales bacterium]